MRFIVSKLWVENELVIRDFSITKVISQYKRTVQSKSLLTADGTNSFRARRGYYVS